MKLIDLGLDFAVTPQFKPYKILTQYRFTMFADVSANTRLIAKQLMDSGWRFYCVAQVRGKCYYNEKVITLPEWIVTNSGQANRTGYKEYYICHEMAHALDNTRSNHGAEFMRILKKICPAEFVHYELDYKPRNAAGAGIQKQKPIDLLEL